MRSIAVAAALALRAIVVVARYEPPPAEDVRWGVVQRLETFGGVHDVRMNAQGETFDIRYTGALDDRICVGKDAIALGFTDGSNGFFTTQLTIGGCFKGNECRPSACLPDEQRPPECRSTRRYE